MARPRELHDPYFKLAKAQGYAARSAFKLLEIQERRAVIRGGNWVLDLGCAPGSWLQVASKIVGSKGRIVGIDLVPVTIDVPPNVYATVGDAFATSGEQLLAMVNDPPADEDSRPPRLFNIVLSDMAPNTTGTPQGDHFRSVTLCRRVLEVLPGTLMRGGHLVMKVFEGESYPELLSDIAKSFKDAKGFRPDATRDVSREIFIVAMGYRGAALPASTMQPEAKGVAPVPPAPRPEKVPQVPQVALPARAKHASKPSPKAAKKVVKKSKGAAKVAKKKPAGNAVRKVAAKGRDRR